MGMHDDIRTEWLNKRFCLRKPIPGTTGNDGTIVRRHDKLSDRQRDFVDADLNRCVSDSAKAENLDGFGVTDLNFDLRANRRNRVCRLGDLVSLWVVGLD